MKMMEFRYLISSDHVELQLAEFKLLIKLDFSITFALLNVEYDRNDPCVIIWSIGNEVPTQESENGASLAHFLQEICHREDPTRPCTFGMNLVPAVYSYGFADALDIPGLNYLTGSYFRMRKETHNHFVLGSETASTVSSRGVYKPVLDLTFGKIDSDHQCSAYDTDACAWSNTPDVDFALAEDYEWTMGQFVWTGFDYLGEPSPYDTDAWPSHSSLFGIFDLASLPKDRFWLYRSQWNKTDHTLHILPHWNCKKGDRIPVMVYTDFPSAELFLNGKSLGVCTKAIAPAGGEAVARIAEPKLWSVDNPYLYGLKISLLRNGKVLDSVHGYTALRKISEKTDEAGVRRLALNDEILFQFGPLDQGWWPDGLYTAPTAEAMAFDIEKTKELGFNMIRKHIKLEPSRWYYDCDRLGMMVWQDMPCIGCYSKREQWGQGEDVYGAGSDYWAATDDIKANYYKEWTEIISQFRKFQSIVVWVPFNEAWGQFDTKAVADYTKSLDPSRLVNAASGGNWIEGAGEILDSHYYPEPKMRILDDGMVNVLGEYGGIGYPVEGHLWEEGHNWGYIQFEDTEAVTDMYVNYADKLIDIRQTDKCAAAVYTQTTDVESEVNGFYTYDRKILKMNPERVREANLKVIGATDSEMP